MARRTTLIRISFPVCEIKLFFQLPSLLPTLSTIPLKATTLDQPIKEGRPKYLSMFVVAFKHATYMRYALVASLVFLIKKKKVLSLLSCCPEALS